ncbi:hypothetical protein PR048_016717 [Dryococelus australis]|uniref:Uncharacterized protein n=1 Tax=Dryococelus australis TaxID=614101 RepID=A0ABQ9H7P7_9NEOP|nr:hypothetical protein PR048_016717 [Dryococelus australis]
MKALKYDRDSSKKKKANIEENRGQKGMKKSPKEKDSTKKMLFPPKKKSKIISKGKLYEDDIITDDECFCLVCHEDFSNSRPGEKWVQCTRWKMWAHEERTEGDTLCYICDNYDSDDDL